MTDTPPGDPWVLVRKRRPPAKFQTLAGAKRFYDHLRFNTYVTEDAAIFGPGREAWYCNRFRDAQWVRDDERRKREAPPIENINVEETENG